MNSRSSNDMHDDDIARVFDAHDVDVPAALDDKILTAARQSGATSSSTAGAHAYRRNNWYMHGFAIAATVILAVAIAPMLVQSPDTTRLSKSAESDVAMMAPLAVDAAASSESTSRTAASSESTLSTTASISREAESTAFADVNMGGASVAESELETEVRTAAKVNSKEETLAARNSSAQAPEALVQKSTSGGSASADPEALAELDRDRAQAIGGVIALDDTASYDPDKPDTWLEAIKTLATENKIATARKEFDKFRARYPDYQVDFRLDEFPQSLKTQEKATD